MFDERRIRDRSLWLDGLPEIAPRPALDGDRDFDVAIVGAGFTGLWTAYALLEADPSLRVCVLEREIAGFGASGRNGGWVSAGIAGDHHLWAERSGDDAVRRAERVTWEGLDWIQERLEREGIDCGYAKGGILSVAQTPAQMERLQAEIASARHWGWSEDDLVVLTPHDITSRTSVANAMGATWTPHGARVNPARMARGLADAVERLGATIFEQTGVTEITPGRAVTEHGTVRAQTIVRATEAFTIQLPGEGRTYLPLYSLMIATEPLGPEVWQELGWEGRETIRDLHHLFFYAQRTTDDRIAIGGRGAPYSMGSPIDEGFERNDKVRERLINTIRSAFPAAGDAAITHHWGGALAVPRDWSMTVRYDRTNGLAIAGGYTGHGVAAASLSGRTLADLILTRDTELSRMPWVDHPVRRWEPEPLRWLASTAIVKTMGSADKVEDEGSPQTARRMRLIQPFIGGH